MQLVDRLWLVALHIIVAVVADAVAVEGDIGERLGKDASRTPAKVRQVIDKHVRIRAVEIERGHKVPCPAGEVCLGDWPHRDRNIENPHPSTTEIPAAGLPQCFRFRCEKNVIADPAFKQAAIIGEGQKLAMRRHKAEA